MYSHVQRKYQRERRERVFHLLTFVDAFTLSWLVWLVSKRISGTNVRLLKTFWSDR